jgi:predicted nucleic acid-binding protein
MSERAFVDTNVIVYLFDEHAPAKQSAAGALMRSFVDGQVVPVVSTQVLQEAYSVLTGKLNLEGATALTLLQKMERSGFIVETTDVPLVWRAANRSIEDKLSFWDSLIVESAIAAQCSVLYTEDLQHGRRFDGLTVVNPFA